MIVLEYISWFFTIAASPIGWLVLELYMWLFERDVVLKKEWGE